MIAAACRDREGLRFAYRSSDGTFGSARRALPARSTGRKWYLVAWDRDREDWRTFRVDRIQPPLTTSRRFAPRELPGGDAAAFVARSISSSVIASRRR